MNPLEIKVYLSGLLHKPARCEYNGKLRVGRIAGVKQGPCIPVGNGEFKYLNQPYGQVYIEWLEYGSSSTKSFKWAGVEQFFITDDKPVPVVVPAPKPAPAPAPAPEPKPAPVQEPAPAPAPVVASEKPRLVVKRGNVIMKPVEG